MALDRTDNLGVGEKFHRSGHRAGAGPADRSPSFHRRAGESANALGSRAPAPGTGPYTLRVTPAAPAIPVRRAAPSPEAIADAARALERGRLVLVPTETVYGLAASARDPAALVALHRACLDAPAPLTWHAPSPQRLLDALALPSGAQHAVLVRLVRRLSPGPVTFGVPLDAGPLAAARQRIGALPGSIDDGSEILVRVPGHDVARRLAETTDHPLVLAAVPDGAEPARDPDRALVALDRRAATALVELVIDAGAAPLGRLSTFVRVGPKGELSVPRPGVYEERYIRKQLGRTVLFVCSGNTCRSPMAQAIASHVIASLPEGPLPIRARSAGTSAQPGAPASPETSAALRALGVRAARHTSSQLTRELLSEADAVFTMTRAHADAARALDPSQAGKIALLDPDGAEIADPIGQPQAVYDSTARAIESAVRRRLAALDQPLG